jgi:ion channel-forming bestrophin family protein
MIVAKRMSWFRLLFSFKGSSFLHTWPRIFFATLIAMIAWQLQENKIIDLDFKSSPFATLGLALGIFLGFRNNESYNRYWDGRKIWGRLVNVSRTFVRQVSTYVTAPEGEFKEIQKNMAYRMIGYVHGFRHHLRDTKPFEDITPFLGAEESQALDGQKNIPMSIAQKTGMELKALWQKGYLTEFHLKQLDDSLTEMLAIQGGCERIRATPIPHVYTVLIHRLTTFYCLSLPLGIAAQAGAWTPVVTFLVSYAFFGLDDLGEELKDPFGIELNDLPLCAINRTIEINLKQLIGEESIPEFLEPVRNQLL